MPPTGPPQRANPDVLTCSWSPSRLSDTRAGAPEPTRTATGPKKRVSRRPRSPIRLPFRISTGRTLCSRPLRCSRSGFGSFFVRGGSGRAKALPYYRGWHG
eukprot:7390680-Prymnesium_polylepis.2